MNKWNSTLTETFVNLNSVIEELITVNSYMEPDIK